LYFAVRESPGEIGSGIDETLEGRNSGADDLYVNGYTIHGRILNASDAPIGFVRLDLDGRIRVTSEADENGVFVLSEIPAGRYIIKLSHSMYKSLRRGVTIRGEKSFDFTMNWITLKGHVSGEGIDIPIESFDIGWVNLEHPKDTPWGKKGFYRSNGDFVLEYADIRYDAIGISARGYEKKIVPIDQFERIDDARVASIVLTPVDGVEGKVVDEEGEPIGGASIFVGESYNRTNDRETNTLTYSGDDGKFRIGKRLGGLDYIVASHPDYAPAYVIYRGEEEKAEYVITLSNASVIQGRVTYDGTPLAEQKIEVMYLDEESYGKWSVRTDRNGRYAISGLPAGECVVDFEIMAKKEMELPFTNAHFIVSRTLEAGATVIQDFEIPVAFGSLEGQIAHDRETLTDPGVLLESANRDTRIRLDASVDEFGYYSVNNVPVGDWTVLILSENSNSIQIVRESASVYADETTLLDIDIYRGTGSISGTSYIGRESIISLYRGHKPADSRKLLQDLRALITLGSFPADMISVSLIIFSSQPDLPYEFMNLPDGKYTLAATMLIEEPFLLNAPAAPLIVREIAIVNGEAIVVDFNF